MSRGLKNNNPGNLRHSNEKWQGETKGSDKAFKTFSSIEWGYRAMFKLLQNYQKLYGLSTLEEIINRYAPPVENHTDNYISAVERWAKVRRSVPINTSDKDVMIRIVSAMSKVENGVPAILSDVEKGWNLL